MAKLTRRSYKRKKVAFAAVILGGVALVSSGFAAWILTGNANQGNTGGVNVGTVQNDTLKMKVYCTDDSGGKKGDAIVDKDGTGDYFSFDADEKDTKQNINTDLETHPDRIYYGSRISESGHPEKLSNTYIIEVTSKTDSLGSFNITMGTGDKSFDSAVNAKFITLPDCFKSGGVVVSPETSGNWPGTVSGLTNDNCKISKTGDEATGFTWTFTYTISFKWGDRFNGKNPCYFFDSDDTSINSTMTRTDKEIGDGYESAKGFEIDNAVIDADLNWFADQVRGATYNLQFAVYGK